MRIIDENGLSLKKFYKTDLGRVFSWKIIGKIYKLWNPKDINPSEKILYCGYNKPFLNIFDNELDSKNQITLFSPFNIQDSNNGVVIDPLRMPLRDSQFNRLISIHTVENAESLDSLLTEFWRVLEPEGRLILAVVNESGFWNNTDIAGANTFTKEYIEQSLATAKFKLHSFNRTIYFPPDKSLQVARILDSLLMVLPSKSGVMIFEAEKRIYASRGRTIKITPTLRERITGRKRAIATKDIA